ncbi:MULTISPECIES: U32 family peptidase [unclassified Blautia]|jgi:putative protease|uniref:U32 family peptidase n=1 Tax=unclassified Blautia TaxID=2648079 RepID=UPI000E40B3C7|nr:MULTISPECIES: U32 family peptidase [unclassified Blautia]HJH88325.1 U32 family peptidase [Fusicatenibacter saccharivorans]RGE90505.1 peptidase U32 [Blautia sp. AM23-13AC]RGF62588.1 peptidase U32 [Blautia sp. AF32-4BH]RHR32846.1 peptidase U32 [Blautia sp. AF19-1]RHV10091.1 peptidase U32 [Blautia sp. OM06-15AC]
MKITSGLGSIDDYPRYVRAGADELFCGYVPFSWSEKYGTVLPLNRREVLNYNVQIGSFSELEILANMVQKYQKPVHLAFNSLYYRQEQYEEITQIIQQCRSIGFDSYILADPALLVYLRKEKIDCEVHLSGDLGTVNSAMTEVFAKEYPKRIIFQRKNTISEMRAVIRHITAQKEAARKEWTYPTEFEAFALNELCQFSGAFCNSLHCDEMGYLCRVPYWKKPMSFSESKLEKQEKNRPGENISISEWDSASELMNPVSEDGYLCGATGCGLCTLKQLSDAGITHLKLVGRGNYTDFMERDIRNLRRTLEILEDSSTEEEYIRAMKAELFPNGCSHMCYVR